MTERLRADPGAFGLVSGVGMHMTKHVYGCYSTTPGPVLPAETPPAPRTVPVVASHEGDAVVAAYSVVHGRDGGPEWAILVCDLEDGVRTYAQLRDPEACAAAEQTELIGSTVRLDPREVDGPMGPARVNIATAFR
jgi:acetyl-CoA C-acetyltransferase